jgi:hypothetical protein
MVAFPNVRRGDRLVEERLQGRRLIRKYVSVLEIDHAAGTALVSVDDALPKEVTARFFATLRREKVKT